MLTPSAPQQVLSVRGLRKMYGDNVAVDDVSFQVNSNEIVGLLAPNGAGKTTTINMVLGVLEPSAGDISIAGVDLARDRSVALGCTNFAAVYAQRYARLLTRRQHATLRVAKAVAMGV